MRRISSWHWFSSRLLLIVLLIAFFNTVFCSSDSKPVKNKHKTAAKNHTFNVVINSSRTGHQSDKTAATRKKDLDTLLSKEILSKVKSLKTNCNCRKSPTHAPISIEVDMSKSSTIPANNSTISRQSVSLFVSQTVTYPVPHFNTTPASTTTSKITLAPVPSECPKCCFCVYCLCKCPHNCRLTTTTVTPNPPIPTYPIPTTAPPHGPDCGCIPMIQPCFVCPCSQSCEPVPPAECPCQVDHSQPYICNSGYSSGVWNSPVDDLNHMRQLMGQGYRYLDMVNSSNPCGQSYPDSYHMSPPSPYPKYPVPSNPQYPSGYNPSPSGYIPFPQSGYVPSQGGSVPSSGSYIPFPQSGYIPSQGGNVPSSGSYIPSQPVKPGCVPGSDGCYPRPPNCIPGCTPQPWPQPQPCNNCLIPPVYPTKMPQTQKPWPFPMPPDTQSYPIGPQPHGYPTKGPVWPYPSSHFPIGPFPPQQEYPIYPSHYPPQPAYVTPPTIVPDSTEETTTQVNSGINVYWSGWMQVCILLIALLPLGLLL